MATETVFREEVPDCSKPFRRVDVVCLSFEAFCRFGKAKNNGVTTDQNWRNGRYVRSVW